MKKLIVDKYSPIKHVCRVNPLGEITPISSFARDYPLDEHEWGDDYVLVYAYRMYETLNATDSEILDHAEHGKHLQIYEDIASLDGHLDVETIHPNDQSVYIQTRLEAQTMMNLLTAYSVVYSNESAEVASSIRDLARCLYAEDGFGIKITLPANFKEFIGVE